MLAPLLRPHRGRVASLAALGIATSFAEGASVTLVADAFGTLLGGAHPPGAFPAGLSGHPIRLLLVVGALLVVRIVAAAAYDLLGDTLSARVSHDIRVAVFGGFVRSSFERVASRGAGSLLNTLEWELFAVPEAVGALASILMDVLAIAIYAAFLLLVSPFLAGLAILCGLVLVPLSAVTTPRLRRLAERMRVRFETLATVHVSTVEGLRTVKLFGAEHDVTARQRDASAHSKASLLAIARHNVAVRAVRRFAVLLVAVLFLLLVARSGVPHATALTAIALLYRIVPHAQSAEGRVTTVLGDSGRLASTVEALRLAEGADTVRDAPPAHAAPIAFGAITLQGIHYRHGPDQDPALCGIDLGLEAGSFTAITGPSGGGKTTLVNLLARLARPSAGTILVDDTPLRAIDRDTWLATAAFAGQDVELLRGTVRDNLVMGRRDLDDAALWEALEIAEAADFVRARNGLLSPVGDRGRDLSGGQRQRLVLARALARRPLLLVLDEATNAVDPDMERRIFAAIRRARPELTVVGITHRGDTSDADRVVTIDLGRITAVAATARRASPAPDRRTEQTGSRG